MKKMMTFALAGVSASLLAACANGIPECQNQDMDKCGFGTVYSEERTEPVSGPKAPEPAPVVVQPPPAPVAQPAPAPAPEPEPAPAPEPVDTSIMRQADEPDLTK